MPRPKISRKWHEMMSRDSRASSHLRPAHLDRQLIGGANMSYRTAGHASQLRHQSLAASGSFQQSTQSSALQQRINEKKVELENLKQLRDLSAGLAGQMEQLEEKLGTLSNGTEGMQQSIDWCRQCRSSSLAVAAVLSNWHNVLRAIHMASGMDHSTLITPHSR